MSHGEVYWGNSGQFGLISVLVRAGQHELNRVGRRNLLDANVPEEDGRL